MTLDGAPVALQPGMRPGVSHGALAEAIADGAGRRAGGDTDAGPSEAE